MTNKSQAEDEFFIGWERTVPPLQRRFLYNRLIGIFALVFSLSLLIPALQTRYESSFFRSMNRGEFEGVFYANPVPFLMVDRPGSMGEDQQSFSSYLLVGPQKNGLSPETYSEFDGKLVRLKGSLIFNHSQTMIEVAEKSINTLSDEAQAIDPKLSKIHLGRYKLSGIIVDSKCYYGALNPGFGKPHRGCSVRSIANGVPPLLLIRSETGENLELLITGPEGQAIGTQILENVEIPVRATGEVYRWGDKYILQVEPRSIEAIDVR